MSSFGAARLHSAPLDRGMARPGPAYGPARPEHGEGPYLGALPGGPTHIGGSGCGCAAATAAWRPRSPPATARPSLAATDFTHTPLVRQSAGAGPGNPATICCTWSGPVRPCRCLRECAAVVGVLRLRLQLITLVEVVRRPVRLATAGPEKGLCWQSLAGPGIPHAESRAFGRQWLSIPDNMPPLDKTGEVFACLSKSNTTNGSDLIHKVRENEREG